MKVFSENGDLQHDENYIEDESRHAESEIREGQAQDVRHGGDRRSAQIAFGDKDDAERIDENTQDEKEIAQTENFHCRSSSSKF